MHFKPMAAMLGTLLLFTACKKGEDSETSALTNQNLACHDYSAAQMQQLKNQVAGVNNFFNNFSNADQNALYKHFGAVPPSYRQYLFDLRKQGTFNGIFKRDLGGGGVMGVCSSTNRGPREIGLTSRHNNAISFAMIHEVGHAVEGMIQRKANKNNRDWEATLRSLMTEANAYNRAGGISRAQQVRDYAFASDAEFFAEAFHNYYCSPDTHKFISTKLPRTYAFLQTVLDKPVWMAGGNAPAPTPAPNPNPNPGQAPTPDDKGADLAQKHVDSIQAAYNKKSSRCDLDVRSVKMVEADGDFVFDMAVQRADGQQLPAVRLRTNYKLPLESELNDLKSLVPRFFAGCPAE